MERLVLLYQGVVVYERKRAKGGLHAIVASLADHLQLKAQSVERLLMAGSLVSPQAGQGDDSEAAETVRAAATDHFDTMIEEMRMPVSYVSNQYPDAAMDRMLLIGGGAKIPGLAEYLDSRLEFEVRSVRLTDLTACSQELEEAHGPALTVAVGLGQFGQR
jgi:Tfp pilus assembly PilM family ATPase